MRVTLASIAVLCTFSLALSAQSPETKAPAAKGFSANGLPAAGPVDIFPVDQVKPGMQGIAYTAFEGSVPEAFPLEIVGVLKNAWGPKQDIIMVKVGGRAAKTGVAGGMSGSPVYIDGKLLGAISLRFGAFLNDAIGGVTPIDLMLEINEKDGTRPAMMQASNSGGPAKLPISAELQSMLRPELANSGQGLTMTPIETPLTFSGFNDMTLAQFGDTFRQLGTAPVAGGASSSGSLNSANMTKDRAKLAASLPPGAPVSMILLDGDYSMASGCTVTYNDLKHVLICGHPFLNFGKLEMPMATADVVTTLGSAFQPTKVLNAEQTVGSFVQDRHSGMLGILGQAPHMIPVEATVHSGDRTKTYHYEIFQNAKFTPFMLTLTAFNTITNLNEFGEDITYRTQANITIDGYPNLKLEQLYSAPDNAPMPGPMVLAFWLGDRFGRIFTNSYEAPNVKGIKLDFDLLPERRTASIEHVWIDKTEVHPGDTITGRVFLKPYRGDRITKDFTLKVPANAPRGDLRIQFSDADYVNRYNLFQLTQNRTASLTQLINVMNQERANGQLFITMLQSSPTGFIEDKILPSLPSSIASVIDSGRAGGSRLSVNGESILYQESMPVEHVLQGMQMVTVSVK